VSWRKDLVGTAASKREYEVNSHFTARVPLNLYV